MSLSKAERALPQYCYCHPRSDYRSFKASEGRFIRNNSVFICNGCLGVNIEQDKKKVIKAISEPEDLVKQWLDSCHAGYEQHFKLLTWEFDFAFPENKLLVEVDGSKHESRNTSNLDKIKQREAEEEGWTVAHVPTGPGLLKRFSDTVMMYLKGGKETCENQP